MARGDAPVRGQAGRATRGCLMAFALPGPGDVAASPAASAGPDAAGADGRKLCSFREDLAAPARCIVSAMLSIPVLAAVLWAMKGTGAHHAFELLAGAAAPVFLAGASVALGVLALAQPGARRVLAVVWGSGNLEAVMLVPAAVRGSSSSVPGCCVGNVSRQSAKTIPGRMEI
jgi:hypothetical protein